MSEKRDILIPSRRVTNRASLGDKLVMQLPNPDTFSSRDNRKKDWIIRSLYEFDYNRVHGGVTLFITLSYSPDKLLWYNIDKHSVTPKGLTHFDVSDYEEEHPIADRYIPVFNHLMKLKYIKMVKQYVAEKYHFAYDDMSYMICDEFGHSEPYLDRHGVLKIGTSAPHHHGVISFPAPPHGVNIDDYKADLVRVCKNFWEKPVASKGDHLRKNWSQIRCEFGLAQGWAMYSVDKKTAQLTPFLEPGIKGQGCIIYVAKYCTKDFSFFGHPLIREYLSKDLDKDVRKQRRAAIAPYLPRANRSKHYGISFLDDLVNMDDNQLLDTLLNGISKSVFDPNLKTFVDKSFRVPRYIVDKLLKDVHFVLEPSPTGNMVKNRVSWSYNERARVIMPIYEECIRRMFQDDLEHRMAPTDLKSIIDSLSDTQLTDIQHNTDSKDLFDSKDSLFAWLLNTYHCYTPEFISHYKQVSGLSACDEPRVSFDPETFAIVETHFDIVYQDLFDVALNAPSVQAFENLHYYMLQNKLKYFHSINHGDPEIVSLAQAKSYRAQLYIHDLDKFLDVLNSVYFVVREVNYLQKGKDFEDSKKSSKTYHFSNYISKNSSYETQN